MWPFKTQDTQTPSNPIPSSSSDGCPVDHSTRQSWLAQHKASTTATSTPSSNPVDPSSTTSNSASKFLDVASSSSSPHSSSSSSSSLSTKREVSSIPRFSFDEQQPSSSSSSPPSSSNWVYPSPSQFFQAMSRKAQQNLYDQPKEEDMPIVVPIHNAVNERAWNQLLEWENLWDDTSQQKCGGVKLVSFIGKPKEKTWRAWGREMMGYQPPFDRHDWLVDRCGHRVRYIIDFYSGKQKITLKSASELQTEDGRPKEFVSFYLDVRPAPDTLEGWLMRGRRSWKNLTGN